MDCGGVLVKYILFLFNMLCLICGILLIVFGSILVSTIQEYNSVQETFFMNSIPISILVLGCVIFFISFLGCCGAIRENTCCTFSYSILMLVLFICQIGLIAVVWTQNTNIINELNKALDQIWAQRATDQSVMDAIQLTLKCCGVNSPADYPLVETLPNSCCGPQATSCSRTQVLNTPGCMKALDSFWETNINIIRYAGLGVAGIQLIAFIFACCLGNQVRNNRRRENY